MNKIPGTAQNTEVINLPADVKLFGHFRRPLLFPAQLSDNIFDLGMK